MRPFKQPRVYTSILMDRTHEACVPTSSTWPYCTIKWLKQSEIMGRIVANVCFYSYFCANYNVEYINERCYERTGLGKIVIRLSTDRLECSLLLSQREVGRDRGLFRRIP